MKTEDIETTAIYDYVAFIKNAEQIIEHPFRGKSFIVIQNLADAYGLMWKDVGADGPNGEFVWKFFVYRFPQYGLLNGQTFWASKSNFKEEFMKALKKIGGSVSLHESEASKMDPPVDEKPSPEVKDLLKINAKTFELLAKSGAFTHKEVSEKHDLITSKCFFYEPIKFVEGSTDKVIMNVYKAEFSGHKDFEDGDYDDGREHNWTVRSYCFSPESKPVGSVIGTIKDGTEKYPLSKVFITDEDGNEIQLKGVNNDGLYWSFRIKDTWGPSRRRGRPYYNPRW